MLEDSLQLCLEELSMALHGVPSLFFRKAHAPVMHTLHDLLLKVLGFHIATLGKDTERSRNTELSCHKSFTIFALCSHSCVLSPILSTNPMNFLFTLYGPEFP